MEPEDGTIVNVCQEDTRVGVEGEESRLAGLCRVPPSRAHRRRILCEFLIRVFVRYNNIFQSHLKLDEVVRDRWSKPTAAASLPASAVTSSQRRLTLVGVFSSFSL